jgi:hypothetical protein
MKIQMNLHIRQTYVFLLALCIMVMAIACKQQPTQLVFASPEAAVQALSDLIGQSNAERADQIFGPGSMEVLLSGDEDADLEDYQRVREMIAESVGFEDFDENTKIALLGDADWPWPIPLVKEGNGWRFDMQEGREELLNRRIGRNELWTLTSLHEIVEAQREYRGEPRDGRPNAYAQRFLSTEGHQDGLYWPTQDESDLSPLGELLAGSENWEDEPHPFQGYYYRILTRRGANAPGGEMDYLDADGHLTRGYGVIAWPAKYGNSGVMTFMTNHRGLVFEKDLGAETAQLAAAIDRYDPDSSWAPTEDSLAEIEE